MAIKVNYLRSALDNYAVDYAKQIIECLPQELTRGQKMDQFMTWSMIPIYFFFFF